MRSWFAAPSFAPLLVLLMFGVATAQGPNPQTATDPTMWLSIVGDSPLLGFAGLVISLVFAAEKIGWVKPKSTRGTDKTADALMAVAAAMTENVKVMAASVEESKSQTASLRTMAETYIRDVDMLRADAEKHYEVFRTKFEAQDVEIRKAEKDRDKIRMEALQSKQATG